MADVALNWQTKLEINTAPATPEAPTWARISKGFKNLGQSLNEAVYQASYLSDEGYGSSTVTGGQYILTLTGDRQYGDPAQDYIFSDAVMYKWGTARETQLRLTRKDGTQVLMDVTLAKITDGGGDSNTVSAITVEIHCNGKPYLQGGGSSVVTGGGAVTAAQLMVAIENEAAARHQEITEAIRIEADDRQGEVGDLDDEIRTTNAVLAGVHTTALHGILLSRTLGDTNLVPVATFDDEFAPDTMPWAAGKTLVFDDDGTEGVIIAKDDENYTVITKALSPVTGG